MNIEKSKYTAFLLNLLIPGLGHIYWKESLFGIFIYLIMLIAVVLLIVTFFVNISGWVILFILILPAIFYLFTFLDLVKTVKTKAPKLLFSRRKLLIFVIIGLLYQSFLPIAPGNFYAMNFPEYFIVEKNNLNPVFQQGNLLKASRLSYIVDFFFLEKPLLHSLPRRYDMVRYENEEGLRQVGIVIGFPGEEIEMAEGVVVVNGLPDYNQPAHFSTITGDCQLTYVDQYSILIGKLNLGAVNTVETVLFDRLIGKVDKVF